MFNWIDWVVMGAYVLGLGVLTVYFQKKASQGLDDYFLGGKQIPWWAMGMSGMASQLDMTGTMLLVSLLFILGPRGMYVEIRGGLGLLMAFAMVFHGKWNRRSNCMTVAEWMEFRFGKGRTGEAARLLQAFMIILGTVGSLAYFIKGSGLFLSIFFPYSPMVCALVLIVIATIYTTLTGFYGVVFTDIFQSGFILLAVICVAAAAFRLVPDNAALSSLAETVSGNADWSAITLPLQANMPKAYAAFENMALAVFYYLFFTILIGVSRSGGKPTYFGARNERECGTLTLVWILTSAIRWPLIIGFVIIGIHLIHDMVPDTAVLVQVADAVKAGFPEVQAHNWGQLVSGIAAQPTAYAPELIDRLQALLGADWPEKLRLVGFHGAVNAEQVLPAVIFYSIPAGLRGLIFVALIAAAMSTFDSQLNMSAAYFVKDFYERLIRPQADTKELIRVSHITCVVIVALALWMGYYAKSINDIWGWIMMGLSGGMAMPALLRWIWWRFNGYGFAGGAVGGTLAAVLQRMLLPDWPVWYSFPAILFCSLIGVLVGTFCSKPTDEETLDNFYRITRPFGFWGPYKSKLTKAVVARIDRENRNDIIALFFAAPWQFLLYWVPVQGMMKNWAVFWPSMVLLLICSVGLYWFWFRNLPKTNSNPFEDAA